MKGYIKIGLFTVLATFLAACTEGDKFDPNREIVLFSGTENTPLVKIDDTTYGLTITATGIAEKDTKVTFAYDESALEKYNVQMNAAYKAIPSNCITFESTTATISAGQYASDMVTISIKDDSYIEEGNVYLLPLSITDVTGSQYEIVDSQKSILLRLTTEYTFNALYIGTAGQSSNYIFSDSQAIDLSTYTFEVKFYATGSLERKSGDQPVRLLSWEEKDESNSILLRFSEGSGRVETGLQVKMPGGNAIQSSNAFDQGKWYVLSIVFDGSTGTLYVDGEAKGSTEDSGTMKFQRWEMGMSWTSYYRSAQLFEGYICEMRLWDKALSVTQMQEGVCNVASDSDGLLAYWRFNEGSGYIFTDSTGNGYDMDWSATQRENTDGGGLVDENLSSYVENNWSSGWTCRN